MDPADSWVVFVGAGAECLASSVVGVATGGADATTCRDAFEQGLSMGCCGVACLRRLDGSDVAWLAALRRSTPHAPLVLVTPLVPDALALVGVLRAAAPPVVWEEEVATRLAPAVREEVAKDPLQRLVAVVSASMEGTPVVRHAMRVAVRTWPPITSVRLLAEALAVSRETLYAHWATCFSGRLRPKEFLEWVVLLRALTSDGRTPIRVAAEVGVDPRTLERLCHRRLGVTFPRARGDGVAPAALAFGERVSLLLG